MNRQFIPWRCTCLCPLTMAWDPAAHARDCGCFVKDETEDDEGGESE